MTRRFLPLLLVLAAAPTAARGQVRVGPEFQVNTYTSDRQAEPVVAADAEGDFVVVWMSQGQDGSAEGVFARWHDASGIPLGAGDVRVNGFTTGRQLWPSVAMNSDGQAVVAWTDSDRDGSSFGIFARRYSPAAVPGPEFQVNTYTTFVQAFPAVAMDASGNFLVVWGSLSLDAQNVTIVGQRYDALGQPLGGEFSVNTHTTHTPYRPAVAFDAAGNFVVVWSSVGLDGDGNGIFAQRYDSAGQRIGGEFQVNSQTLGHQRRPAIASLPAGGFVVVWESSGGGSYDVAGQRYDPAGAPAGSEFRANGYLTSAQRFPDIAADPDGRFVVTWTSEGQDSSGWGVFARRYDALGGPEGGEFRINSYTTFDQRDSRVTTSAGGDFVAVWSGSGRDGDQSGVSAQRFKPDLIFRDGFEDGGIGAWSFSSVDAGDLSVSALAGLNFTTAGLHGLVDDTAAIYVQDDRPDGENRYRARFYFDPNGFDPGEAANHFRMRIFIAFSEAPTRRVLAIVLRRLGGQYSIRARARLDDNSQADTAFIPITDGAHAIEFDLRRAPSPGLNVGSLTLRIDGDTVASMMLLDNSLSEVDFVRMGALTVKAGASGTLYWDEYESRRQGAIGP